MVLRADHISYKVGKSVLLQETSLSFAPCRFHVIMGANGAGKSTLLKLLSGSLLPTTGHVYFQEKDLKGYRKSELAAKRAVLSQQYLLSFPVTVGEVVMMGRYPYFGMQPAKNDIAICREAMQLMDVFHLAERDYTTLSGGEAQKVQMSRVLAQIWNDGQNDQKILFLDEPVSHLDIKYQQQLLAIARQQCLRGATVIAVLHDLNLAIHFADRIYLMKEGRLLYELENVHELTPHMINETFGVSTRIIAPEGHPKPVVLF